MAERPVRDMLSKYVERGPARFHMPGHKGSLSLFDVTELDSTDDLNNPGRAIKRAQELLSASYGSNSSFFLCGGSTEGLKAMFRYLKIAGHGIIMPRGSHKNAFYACIENNIEPLVFNAGEDAEYGALSYEGALIGMMNDHPEAGAIFVTRPDYYGRCIDLKVVSRHARRLGMLILCDSAHGAHFALSEMLPYDVSGYADIWVHSAHKTLGALTPSAYLHCSENIDRRLMERILPSVRTSSPNYEIIMSMDDSRAYNFDNPGVWDKRINEIDGLITRLKNIPGIMVRDKSWAESAGYNDKDPSRLVIDVRSLGGGFYVKKQLEFKDVFVEMANFMNITAIMTPCDKPEWDDMLIDGLKSIKPAGATERFIIPSGQCNRVMPMGDAYYSGKRFVELTDAQGCISADLVGAYPPGTPAVLPGEVIDKAAIEYLMQIEQRGGSLFGTSGGVRVL